MCIAHLYYVLRICSTSKMKIALVWTKKNERKGFCRSLTPLTRRLYCSEFPVNYNKSKLSPYPLLLTVRAKPSTIAQGLPISCSTLAKRLRTSARQDPISTRAIHRSFLKKNPYPYVVFRMSSFRYSLITQAKGCSECSVY